MWTWETLETHSCACMLSIKEWSEVFSTLRIGWHNIKHRAMTLKLSRSWPKQEGTSLEISILKIQSLLSHIRVHISRACLKRPKNRLRIPGYQPLQFWTKRKEVRLRAQIENRITGINLTFAACSIAIMWLLISIKSLKTAIISQMRSMRWPIIVVS